jgi:capsular polysaccharide biosynthesis protein
MGITEPFRCIVLGHIRLIGALFAVPLCIAIIAMPMSSSRFVASSRIQASSAALGSTTEADSILNRVSGVATSPAIVAAALKAAGIAHHDAATTAGKDVAVRRLGSSAVMDIEVTDSDRRVARTLANSLAKVIVDFIDGAGSAQPTALVERLTTQQASLSKERGQVVTQIASTADLRKSAALSGRLSTIDQELSDVTSTLRQLQVVIATDSSGSVISSAGPAVRAPSSSTLSIGLIGVGALVLGLLVAALIEVVRPRLAGARAVARELGAPVLGRMSLGAGHRTGGLLKRRTPPDKNDPPRSPLQIDPETVIALRRAAARADVSTLALVATGDRTDTSLVARELTARLAMGRPSANGRARKGDTLMASASAASDGMARAADSAIGTVTKQKSVSTRDLRGVRVVSISALASCPPTAGCQLIVLPQAYPSVAQVHRINDLSAATGWPVAGVLDASRTRRWGRRRS